MININVNDYVSNLHCLNDIGKYRLYLLCSDWFAEINNKSMCTDAQIHRSMIRMVCTPLHWENYISISFHIEWGMIVVTVFFSILSQMEFQLVQYRKESCHHDHIPFNLKGNENIVFSVCMAYMVRSPLRTWTYLKSLVLYPELNFVHSVRNS